MIKWLLATKEQVEQYTKKVIEHFMNPSNMGVIKDADAVGEVGNLKCGDVMKIYLKIGKRSPHYAKATRGKQELPLRQGYAGQAGDREEYIEDIKFQTLGCAAAIATSSVVTELAMGKTLDEAEKINQDDINEVLGKLPAPKYHCSVLADKAIKAAIVDYKSRKNG
ncbi:MAG: iron-sulfur cluster assembly scaffold protein [Candidatus Berkelbacteria bacterium]